MVSGIATPLPTTTNVPLGFTNGNAIACMYAFVSGGTEYHIYSNTMTTVTMQQSTIDGTTGVGTNYSDPRRRNTYNKPRVVAGSSDSAQHFKMPMYSRTPTVPTKAFSIDTTSLPSSYTLNQPTITTIPQITPVTVGPDNLIISVNASDDARCHVYIGPPPCFLFQSLQSAEVDSLSNSILL